MECGRFAGDFDGLGGLAGRESEIEKDALLHSNSDITMFYALKTFEFDANSVDTDFDGRKDIFARARGGDGVGSARVLTGESHLDTGEDAAGAVFDRAENGTGVHLGECTDGKESREDEEREKAQGAKTFR